jgi:hypothetical protein
MKIPQINEKYNSRAKNYCNRKIALLEILIQLSSFVTKKEVFWPPTQKSWLWQCCKCQQMYMRNKNMRKNKIDLKNRNEEVFQSNKKV